MLLWPFFLSFGMFSRFIHTHSMNQYFILFFMADTLFQLCRNAIICPFISHLTFGLSSAFGYVIFFFCTHWRCWSEMFKSSVVFFGGSKVMLLRKWVWKCFFFLYVRDSLRMIMFEGIFQWILCLEELPVKLSEYSFFCEGGAKASRCFCFVLL